MKHVFLSSHHRRIWLASILLLTTSSVLAASTTLGTRQLISQPNEPVTSNANAKWTTYSRELEYPRTRQLPLQFINTREGGKLAVLVTVPADENGEAIPGQFPAILTQTAYRIDLGALLGAVLPSQTTLLIGGEDKYMIRRGYISVAIDARGTGMSSGITRLIGEEEQAAAADAVDWINEQPWFDGNLGLAGTSYLGLSALLTAAQQHPSVKAVFAQVPMGDAYRGTAVTGGMLNANFINTWLTLTQNLSVANDAAKLVWPQYADQIDLATQDHVAAIDDWYLPTINNALDNLPGYASDDGDFWAVRSPVEKAADIRVPTVIVGGANDIFQRGQPLLYEQMKRNTTTKLVIVPGAHVQAIVDSLVGNNLNGGPQGSQALLLRWFDHYLKGIDTGAPSLPNVTQYVEGYGLLGLQRYATATDWPHPKMAPVRYYLRGNKSLTTAKPGWLDWSIHRLKEAPAPLIDINKSEDGTQLSGEVTINDSSECSSSGVQWSLGLDGLLPRLCHSNNTFVEMRQDAIVYETPMLWRDMYINGPMQADIWMSASKPQAALSIRVSMVDALGVATPISTGLQSAAFREVDPSRSRYVDGVMIQPWHPFTAASAQPLVPGKPVLVPVEIFPAAALIRAGQRLRISISASNQAQGIWPLPIQGQVEGTVITIHNDAKYPSSVVLPVVPASELN
jgi:uncharacterized protein